VKQGSCCVGLVSKTHAVLATLKRSNSELGSHQQKVFKIDDHMGIGIAGLTPVAPGRWFAERWARRTGACSLGTCGTSA